jgi:hypothetical protein
MADHHLECWAPAAPRGNARKVWALHKEPAGVPSARLEIPIWP